MITLHQGPSIGHWFPRKYNQPIKKKTLSPTVILGLEENKEFIFKEWITHSNGMPSTESAVQV